MSNREIVKIIDRNFDSSSSAHSNGPFSLYHSFLMYNGQALTSKTVMLHPSFGFWYLLNIRKKKIMMSIA